MPGIDAIRHMSVFDPSKFSNIRVDVVGCGATGSRIALSLAKLGLVSLHLWDFDIVEEVNLANQIFQRQDISRPKVEAVAREILSQTGVALPDEALHNEKVDGSQRLGKTVFLLTDTMASRREIWEGAVKYKFHVKALIETRMGVNDGRVYFLNPCDPLSVERWEETLCDDAVTAESACGTSITVGPTADVIAGIAMWQFIRFCNSSMGDEDVPEFEVIFGLCPPITSVSELHAGTVMEGS